MTHGLHLLEIYLKYHLLNKQKFPNTFGLNQFLHALLKSVKCLISCICVHLNLNSILLPF